jgi:hypothetical protein
MTASEKAAERAKHYRTVQREARGEYVKKPDANRTMVQPAQLVQLSEHGKKVEAARGLKEKPAAPVSVRKPYVGAKMKRDFLESGKSQEELKAAIKVYKKGGVSWASLY